MVRVYIPATLRSLCGGSQSLELQAGTVEELLRAVEARCPGFYDRVVEDGRLRPELAFAINGEVVPLALHEPLPAGAELTIVPALGGG
ncbi:MoaD/ThiS family protein [Tepidiforma sp.]|uniref:MoaD/ThiS family protein n=1 Tax=Tepidiforma sp. TaxID=2682230 RepID=UPI002ADE04AE|nr:MoaD/ThiS family protein [Tepidiforma sp.]